jgi:hypothetical protein
MGLGGVKCSFSLYPRLSELEDSGQGIRRFPDSEMCEGTGYKACGNAPVFVTAGESGLKPAEDTGSFWPGPGI